MSARADHTYELVARASNEVAAKLARRLVSETQGEVNFSAADCARYATDASIYQVIPSGVFLPKTDADVSAALQISRELKVAITARGGGTSQCGQTVGAGLVIDFSKHMRQVLQVDLQARSVQVQPGIVLDHLNAQLKAQGLWFPVDVSTSAQATIGGMAGNNSCGSRSLAYGNMVHNVSGASIWRADGTQLELSDYSRSKGRERAFGEFVQGLATRLRPEIAAHWPKVMRRVAGYNLDVFDCQSQRPYTADGSVNLAHLLIGSEGTLGITRSLTLQLAELPRAKVLGVVNFASFYKAMDSAQHIVALGASLSAVELVDRTMIELALKNPAFAPTVHTALTCAVEAPEALLLVEFSGMSKADLLPQLAALEELMGELGLPGTVVRLVEDAAQKALWEVRKAGLNIMMSLRGDGKPVSFIEDCAVPLEHLAEYTQALSEVFARYGTRGTWYAHASVGTLHVRPILDMRRDGASKMRSIAEEAASLVRKFKGAYSGEHGDGLCRGEWIAWQFGPAITQAFAAIKQYLDPQNLLNPQRVLDPPQMDDPRLLRLAPSYTVVPIQPVLDWRSFDVQNDPLTEQTSAPGTGGDPAQGLAKAVEMCNNNGHCRKFDAGTMCPSYRVTRDEQHATRGRANTLRLALSGQLDAEGLASSAVKEALDLCVSCKACKRECPTGVDMAKMKIEASARYAAQRGHSLRAKLIAHLPRYAPYAATIAPLLNLRNRSRVLARAVEKLFGLSAQRSLPVWRRRHFFKQAHIVLSAAELKKAAKPVLLFVDTFNGYFESENAQAALAVLRAAGYTVGVAGSGGVRPLCCGRTYLAAGMVNQAKTQARALLDHLLPYARAAIPIVGLEPSCLLTLRDESLHMGFGKDAETVAKQALLFEEFLSAEDARGALAELRAKLEPATRPVLLHGHCHQKAFGAVQPILQVLDWVPNAKPQLIESSCCGMAGAFGYEAEHFAVSQQMAELALLPAVRAAPHASLVADGASCRHQIQDGAAVQAVHLSKWLAAHLESPQNH